MAEISPFGMLLRRYRLEAGLTQEKLAERAGLSVRAIRALERGERRYPYPGSINLLAQALNLDRADRQSLVAASGRQIGDTPRAPAANTVELPRLAGRSSEIALLRQHIGRTGAPLLLYAGEPGIGKSRLLQEARALAVSEGMTVLHGGCHRRGGEGPFSPFVEALAAFIENQQRDQLHHLLDGCEWLIRLLPELAALGLNPSTQHLPHDQERRLMFRAVARFLDRAAEPRGALLLLDDLQWAKDDAFDLLAYLARSSPSVRIVGAVRHTEVNDTHSLSTVMNDLRREDLVQISRLSPLGSEDATRLLKDVVGDGEIDAADCRHAADRAGGVPLFVVSFGRALRDGAAARLEIPDDLRSLVHQQVAVLPRAVQEVLWIASVAGGDVSFHLLANVSHFSERELLDALDSATDSGLLTEIGSGAYRFSHDLVREAIEAEMGAARRVRAHLRIGRVLADLTQTAQGAGRDGDPTEIAQHFLAGGDTHQALIYTILAGDYAARVYAHHEAELQFRGALRLIEDVSAGQSRDGREAEVREKLSGVFAMTGRLGEALDQLERASKLYRRLGNVDAEGRVVARIGQHQARINDIPGAAARVSHFLAEDPDVSPETSARLYAVLARCVYGEEGLAIARRAALLAREIRDDRLLAEARLQEASTLIWLDRVDDGEDVLVDARRLADEAGDLDRLKQACMWIGRAALLQNQPEKATAAYEQALRVAEQLGPIHEAEILHHTGAMYLALRDTTRARASYENALAVISSLDVLQIAIGILYSLGDLCVRQGDQEAGSAYLNECIRLAQTCRFSEDILNAHASLAEGDVLSRCYHSAVTRLEAAVSMAGRRTHVVHALLAQAYLAVGRRERATEIVRWGMSIVGPSHHPDERMVWLTTNGMLARHERRWAEADLYLEQALALARKAINPHQEGKILMEWGTAYLQRGDMPGTERCLDEACRIFHQLESGPYIDLADRLMSRLRSR